MKYSHAQQKLHLEKVYTIFSHDPTMSARHLWRELNRQGFHVSRQYVTKLMWRACEKLTLEEKRTSDLAAKLLQWRKEVNQAVQELYDKIRGLDRAFPDEDDKDSPHWL